MSSRTIIFCTLVFLTMFSPVQASDLPYKPGELIVRFAPNADGIQHSTTEKTQILSSLGGATIKHNFTTVPGLCIVELPVGQTVEDALKTFNKANGILYAEPDYEELIEWFKELWLDEEAREAIDEDTWLKFIESLKKQI